MTVAEVAEALGVGERFVRRLTGERRLPFFKIGGKVRFAREDLEAFMSGCHRQVGHTFDPSEVLEFLDREAAATVAAVVTADTGEYNAAFMEQGPVMADDARPALRRAFDAKDLPEAIRLLEGVLKAVESGDLVAPSGLVHQLHGAVIALQSL
jgi:excisionase family DNA binding protein